MKKRLFLPALFLSACAAPTTTPTDYGDPTLPVAPAAQDGIVAYVVAPRGGETTDTSIATIAVAAKDEQGQPLVVRVGTSTTDLREAKLVAEGDIARFEVQVPLLHGQNRLYVRVETADGARGRSFDQALRYDGAAPGLRLHVVTSGLADACATPSAVKDGITAAPSVCLEGQVSRAASATASDAIVVRAGAGGTDVNALVTTEGRFQVAIPLTRNTKNELALHVTVGSYALELPVTLVQDDEPPSIVFDGARGSVLADAASYTLAGNVSDRGGVADVRLQSLTGATLPLAFPGGRWSATTQLEPGENQVAVLARDRAGNEARAPFVILRERTLDLHLPKPSPAATNLRLDRFALESLFTEADQKGIVIVEVPLRPAIVSAMKAIRDPAAYGVDTSTWGAPERNLSRLLNTTPDSADLAGTSVERLLAVANAVGLPAPRILADLFAMGATDTFLEIDTLADVVTELLVGTHPNAVRDKSGQVVLRLSLFDVFDDLRTVGPRFGPNGAHPGFLDGATQSMVLEPGFAMAIPTRSNLTQYDGIDAATSARDFLFRAASADALSFDFDSKDFTVVGLVDEPKVNLRFKVTEKNGLIRAGTVREAGADATRPGFFRGASEAFTASPWLLERVCAESVYRRFVTLHGPSYTKKFTYDAGAIKGAAVIDWNRGWLVTTTAGGIGNPPPPVYAWDLLTEVAQVRLHDGTTGVIPEGQANVSFTLKDLPIGFTADELIAKVKPVLRTQEAKLSKLLAGSQGLATTTADVYLVPADDGGVPFLFFRAKEDGTGTYPYATPGLFSDAALTQKVSSLAAVPGSKDTTHEKLRLDPGKVLFFKDEGGTVYQLDVVALLADGARIHVAALKGTP